MDVPPAVRVTLVAVERGALARFARAPAPSPGIRHKTPSSETEGHTGIPALRDARVRLDELITIGVRDTVTFIKGLAEPLSGAPDDRSCLSRNIIALSQPNAAPAVTKLRGRDVRILRNRIVSLLDLLSLHDTARLLCAVAHLDRRLSVLIRPAVEHYLQTLSGHTTTPRNADQTLTSLALVVTSMEIIARTQPQQHPPSRQLQGIQSDSMGDTAVVEPVDGFRCEYGATAGNGDACLLGDIDTPDGTTAIQAETDANSGENADSGDVALTFKQNLHYGEVLIGKMKQCLEVVDTTDLELMILLAQTLGNVYFPAAAACESLFRDINVDAMSERQLCQFTHACALASNTHKVNLDSVVKQCMDQLAQRSTHNAPMLDAPAVAQAFHASYLTDQMDHELMGALSTYVVSNKVTFSNATEFYRTAIPLAVTGHLAREDLCLWALNELASNADFSREVSHFLFLLTSIAHNVKVAWKPRDKLALRATALETDIYEKAEIYLRQMEGERNRFPSPRAAVLYLIERANGLIKTSSNDEFVQILLLNCVRNFKPDSRIRFELLNECKKRVNEISCGGIPQVLQTLFTLFSPNAPELVEAFALYLDRVLAEVTMFNSAAVPQIDGSRLFALTFLQDISLLGNVLAVFDRCNLNRGDLAVQVVEMLERSNFHQLETAGVQPLVDLLHYLAFSLDRHDALDVIAVVLQRHLQRGAEVSAGQLAAVAECFVAAPLALNPLRHQALLQSIRQRAGELRSTGKALQTILDRLG